MLKITSLGSATAKGHETYRRDPPGNLVYDAVALKNSSELRIQGPYQVAQNGGMSR